MSERAVGGVRDRSAKAFALLLHRAALWVGLKPDTPYGGARVVGERCDERLDGGGIERAEDAQRLDPQCLVPRAVEDDRRQTIDDGRASRSAHEHARDAGCRRADVRIDRR